MTVRSLDNLYRLRVFIQVADLLSFSQAARRMSITQPAVSRHIHELEARLSVTLFDRGKPGLSLTEAGYTLYRRSKVIADLVDETTAEMAGIDNEISGPIKIGGSDAWTYVLPRLLGEFRLRHPKVELQLTFRPSLEIADFVLQGQLGLGFMAESSGHPGLDVQPVGSYELWLISGTDHPLAKNGRVEIDDLHGLPFIRYQADYHTPTAPHLYLDGLGVQPDYVMELGSTEAMKGAVEAGFGLSLLPSFAVEHEIESNRLARIHLEAPPCIGALFSARAKSKFFSPTQRAVLDHVSSSLLQSRLR